VRITSAAATKLDPSSPSHWGFTEAMSTKWIDQWCQTTVSMLSLAAGVLTSLASLSPDIDTPPRGHCLLGFRRQWHGSGQWDARCHPVGSVTSMMTT